MPEIRRTPRRRSALTGSPRDRTGPGRVPGTGLGRGGRVPLSPRVTSEELPRRPRFTGRAAILVLVVAVLTVSYASSLRAYLEQRSHIQELKSQIAAREAAIDDLEREKRRWHDPAYVQAQARERFGYLMPGETSYVVLGEDGKPLDGEKELPRPTSVDTVAPPWWNDVWDSVELAGNPPRHEPPPETEIEPPADQIGSE